MKRIIACSAMIVLFMFSMGSLLQAKGVTEKYVGATNLMKLAAKAKYEGNDEVAWAEYERAHEALAEIQRHYPKWNARSVAASMERCKKEMDALNPESLSKEKGILKDQEKAMELISEMSSQAEDMTEVFDESRDALEK